MVAKTLFILFLLHICGQHYLQYCKIALVYSCALGVSTVLPVILVMSLISVLCTSLNL